MISKILLTGSSGFIGSKLFCRLSGNVSILNFRLEHVVWDKYLNGIDTVVHLAAQLNIQDDLSSNLKEDIYYNNTIKTHILAQKAALAGVKRFIFLSSIKVNGNSTSYGKSFTEIDHPLPSDPYAVSKYNAENFLRQICCESGMEFVIIRPPLVYGPGVKGNFAMLRKVILTGIPIPLALLNNKRSFISVDNLIDFILLCCNHPKAANNIFLVSDGFDISTYELLKIMSIIAGTNNLMIPFPIWILKLVAYLLGRKSDFDKLSYNLRIDINKSRTLLGWSPPFSIQEEISKVMQK
jgi:UDP-glucose 4-epimerase